jgi:hypothetical protein
MAVNRMNAVFPGVSLSFAASGGEGRVSLGE